MNRVSWWFMTWCGWLSRYVCAQQLFVVVVLFFFFISFFFYVYKTHFCFFFFMRSLLFSCNLHLYLQYCRRRCHEKKMSVNVCCACLYAYVIVSICVVCRFYLSRRQRRLCFALDTIKTSYGITNGNWPIKKKWDSLKSFDTRT